MILSMEPYDTRTGSYCRYAWARHPGDGGGLRTSRRVSCHGYEFVRTLADARVPVIVVWASQDVIDTYKADVLFAHWTRDGRLANKRGINHSPRVNVGEYLSNKLVGLGPIDVRPATDFDADSLWKCAVEWCAENNEDAYAYLLRKFGWYGDVLRPLVSIGQEQE